MKLIDFLAQIDASATLVKGDQDDAKIYVTDDATELVDVVEVRYNKFNNCVDIIVEFDSVVEESGDEN
jgi:hypothetical protein